MVASAHEEEIPSASVHTNNHSGLYKVYIVRSFAAAVLIVLGAASCIVYGWPITTYGTFLILGAVATGIAMGIAVIVNVRLHRPVRLGTATVLEKTYCTLSHFENLPNPEVVPQHVRSEVVICAVTVLTACFGLLLGGINGRFQSSIHPGFYYSIMVVLGFSVIMNLFFLVFYWTAFKTEGMNVFSSENDSKMFRPQNQGQLSSGFGFSPPAHQGVVLHAPSGTVNPPMSFDGRNIVPSSQMVGYQPVPAPIAVNNQYQSQTFQGPVVTHPYTGNSPSYHQQRENNSSNDNSRLISDLQSQNQHLREQLALQQRLLGNSDSQTVPPTASELEAPPPSYDACLRDPSQIQHLEEQNRLLEHQYRSQNKVLSETMSDYRHDNNPVTPSAPSL